VNNDKFKDQSNVEQQEAERKQWEDCGMSPERPDDWSTYIPELDDMGAYHVLHENLAVPMIDPDSPLLDEITRPAKGVRMADLINEAWDSQKKQGREPTNSVTKDPIVEAPFMDRYRGRMKQQEAKLSPEQRSEMDKRDQILKTSFQKKTEPGHEPDGGPEI